jgi:micrococcal nuclease
VRAPVAPPPPSGGGGGGRPGLHPSYRPCIPTDRDYDCGELSDGPYTVTGDDPYRLDADGNGIGCE